ncbi:MAG: ribonucleoside-diphosphate reductase, adenosylcobalamin-dependent [Elusimicrobia bacterium RIFCSPLOWO2_12_FULL_59_9]|nr:MAG: ribonucleoside-diphosphate reductase, adenosylcobalamin-dependent [Elusimicrobia bacterium RIFCSPLOWO2_12_FULL_59_9]
MEREKPASKDKDARIFLTENQRKVIKDKYLRDAPSPEKWLRAVARNIALSEIFFHADAQKWGVFQGIHFVAETPPVSGGKSSRMLLFHAGLADCKQREDNFKGVIKNLERAARTQPAAKKLVEFWEEEFYDLLSRFDFLPNSPTLMNAGRQLQQLSACYVLPVEDSIEKITHALHAQALIQKSGGGTGFSFGRLRPKGDIVQKTQGVASGPLSFMQIFDKMTDVVKQGGSRRGANMGILPYWHPEIQSFIAMKAQPGMMENFNVSVGIDAKFMRAVQDDAEYELLNPRTNEVAGKLRAKEVFDKMAEFAWQTGDPGFVVLDRINQSASNPTPAMGEIESTNPCGEVPLLPWEPCNLGSISLPNFIEGPVTRGRWNLERLGAAVQAAVRFLDDVIEINNYPLPEIERIAKGNRRIGLGIMGWAEALVKLGVPYDSEEALEQAGSLMELVNRRALKESEELAKQRGVFPYWKNSIYDPKGPHYRGQTQTPRNCARSTIAPTGTIAIAAGLQGGGIEPFFGIAYTRYNAKALDALKSGSEPDAADVFIEVNPLFREVARANNFFGMKEKDLFAKIDENHKSVRGISDIPEDIQRLFPTAHDVPVDFHVRIQAAFQKHVDNGVSKTVNLPNSASVEDVRRVYYLAYELGCKGVTIYRDGSKAQQVLSLKAAATRAQKHREVDAFGVSSEYYQINTGYGPLHMHLNYDETGPYQIFTNLPPLGTEISGLTSLIGILLSKYFEAGGDPVKILKHLNSVKGDRPVGFGENRINSIAHAISIALRNHLKKTGFLESEGAEKPLELWQTHRDFCPNCYSSNVGFESGCSGPTCHDCGYSECS